MNIDDTVKKLIYQLTMTLPGYAQLRPRAQLNLQYQYKKILKELLTSVTKEEPPARRG